MRVRDAEVEASDLDLECKMWIKVRGFGGWGVWGVFGEWKS